MLDFSFSAEATKEVGQEVVSAAGKFLKAWGVYTVKYMGAEFSSGTGKESGKKWEAIKFMFEDENGATYNHMLFAPQSKEDTVRRTYTKKNGEETQFPSNAETFKYVLADIVGILHPVNFNKLKNNFRANSAQEFCDKVIQATNPSIGKEFQIKLVGNKQNYATAPSCFIVKNFGDEALTKTNNFIGSNLSMSTWEVDQAEKAKVALANAKPTSMPKNEELPLSMSSNSVSFDDNELDLNI